MNYFFTLWLRNPRVRKIIKQLKNIQGHGTVDRFSATDVDRVQKNGRILDHGPQALFYANFIWIGLVCFIPIIKLNYLNRKCLIHFTSTSTERLNEVARNIVLERLNESRLIISIK